jgi:PST family polysaccharide transporter
MIDADTEQQASTGELHARARRGIKLLLIRQVFVQIVTFAGGVVLARALGPAQFGLFVIATFWVTALALLGDFGLAASFIQRRAALTDRDLQVGFTLQQILTSIIVVAIFALAPWIVKVYPNAPPETVWLIRAMAFSLYLTTWRAISALQLERRLHYSRLAWIEVVESLSFQVIAVLLAVAGFGVWSLVAALMARGILGVVLVYLASPWRVRFAFDRKTAREIVRYGIPFQLLNITASLGVWISPIFVAHRIGPQAVGYLTWASSNGRKPQLILDNVRRVAFPHISRIQENRAEIERVLARYLVGLLLCAGLWAAVLITAGPALVEWIYTVKWTPAVPALMLYSLSFIAETIAWVFAVALNGVGLVGTTTRVMMIRTGIIVVLAIPLVLLVGYNGVAVAYFAGVTASIPWLVRAHGPGTFQRVLVPVAWLLLPFSISILAGELVAATSWPLPVRAMGTTLVVTVTFTGVAWRTGPSWMRQATRARVERFLPARLVGILTKASRFVQPSWRSHRDAVN